MENNWAVAVDGERSERRKLLNWVRFSSEQKERGREFSPLSGALKVLCEERFGFGLESGVLVTGAFDVLARAG